MRKYLLVFSFSLLVFLPANADEGMWLPAQIESRIGDMRSKGLRLRANDLYSDTEPALNRAVVMFGSGCTGAIVSADGLLLTNHHCGYSQIVDHSTVEHDYLTNGFWAMNRAEELPNEKLQVRIMVRMEDVTEAVNAGRNEELIREAEQDGRYKAEIKSLYYGGEHWMWVYEVFKDVRLVGAPPSAIGKFGGDTDNWMWPRHTGDFSIFRIYAGADNKPAEYSPDNVPYRPARFFEIDPSGAKEGDFTMVYGFPGSTRQYVISDEVRFIAGRSNPMKIAIRTRKLDSLRVEMESSPARRIELATEQAGIANAWKKWQGESWGIERRGTILRKLIEEERFQRWASSRPRFAHLLDSLHAAYARWEEPVLESERTYELDGKPRPLSFASTNDIVKWYTPYMRALREMQPERDFYPDANFTLRIAYGKVEGYTDENGVWQEPFTDLAGVIAKDNPEVYDYNVPERLRELAADYGDVPVCFLASNHTSGGNSGSPVLNARGQLIGLNFDRTWLGTMSDLEFSDEFCRNISVDIRYVMMVTEMVGGARWIVDEMRVHSARGREAYRTKAKNSASTPRTFFHKIPCGRMEASSSDLNDMPTTDRAYSERRRFAYSGFSGGMMLHTGVLGGGETSGGQKVKGAPFGLGGVARIHLGKHLRVGAEGYVSTLHYGSSGSHARIGWGGVLADWVWQRGRWSPYTGLTIGGGGMKNYTEIAPRTMHYEHYSFMVLVPFGGVEYSMTERVRLNIKADWLLNLTDRRADFPSGPKIYFGVSFYRHKE